MSSWPRSAFAGALARSAADRLGLARVDIAADKLERLWASVRSQPLAASVALPAELGGGFVPWDLLVEAITTRETYFFRHPEQLELLRKHVLTEQRVNGLPLLRVWSAGCASGEEAYSLTMLCEQEGMLEHAHVLGTDVCQVAIETARSACYRDWSLRGLAPDTLARYFEVKGTLHRVREHLRRHVTFRTLNLIEPCYPNSAEGTAGLTLICCRNVLMFLEPSAVQQIARRLFDALAPGGFLLTGPSDPNLSGALAWDVLVSKAGLLYRKPGLSSTTFQPEPTSSSQSHAGHRAPSFEPETEPQPDPASPSPLGSLIPANDTTPIGAAAVRRAWNTQGAQAALARCHEALAITPDALELLYLRALLLWELGQQADALSSMRMVLYLDREQPVAHFGLAVLHERAGELDAARRCYRNVLNSCDGLPGELALPLGDGLTAAGMRTAAEQALSRLASRKVSA